MVPIALSKYDLLQLFNKYFRNGSVVIHPDAKYISDKSLKRTRFDFDYESQTMNKCSMNSMVGL